MEGPHGPQTQVREGACAIKVSMRSSEGRALAYISSDACARTTFIVGILQLAGGLLHSTAMDKMEYRMH